MKTFKEHLSESVVARKATSPHDQAERGEYTATFPGSPKAASHFANHIHSKGGKARIVIHSGNDHHVYHKGAGPISKHDWSKQHYAKKGGVTESLRPAGHHHFDALHRGPVSPKNKMHHDQLRTRAHSAGYNAGHANRPGMSDMHPREHEKTYNDAYKKGSEDRKAGKPHAYGVKPKKVRRIP